MSIRALLALAVLLPIHASTQNTPLSDDEHVAAMHDVCMAVTGMLSNLVEETENGDPPYVHEGLEYQAIMHGLRGSEGSDQYRGVNLALSAFVAANVLTVDELFQFFEEICDPLAKREGFFGF